jgi:hypothetical protein
MRNNLKIAITVFAIIIIGAFVYYYKTKDQLTNQVTPAITQDSIKGCYIAYLAKDVYTLSVLSQDGESFDGKLSFKNFEKDSSSGTYVGTYKNGILLGDYSFSSEGMNSVMQVIFKKSGNNFIRGYGDLNGEGTRFSDLNKITYDNSQVFEAQKDCASGPTATSNNPVFEWRYAKADLLNLDGQPKTNTFLKVTYPGGANQEKLISTTDGGCNDLPDANEGQVLNSKIAQCYYAGLGYRLKVTRGEKSYLIEQKKFEEASPGHTPRSYKYEVISEFPF